MRDIGGTKRSTKSSSDSYPEGCFVVLPSLACCSDKIIERTFFGGFIWTGNTTSLEMLSVHRHTSFSIQRIVITEMRSIQDFFVHFYGKLRKQVVQYSLTVWQLSNKPLYHWVPLKVVFCPKTIRISYPVLLLRDRPLTKNTKAPLRYCLRALKITINWDSFYTTQDRI